MRKFPFYISVVLRHDNFLRAPCFGKSFSVSFRQKFLRLSNPSMSSLLTSAQHELFFEQATFAKEHFFKWLQIQSTKVPLQPSKCTSISIPIAMAQTCLPPHVFPPLCNTCFAEQSDGNSRTETSGISVEIHNALSWIQRKAHIRVVKLPVKYFRLMFFSH